MKHQTHVILAGIVLSISLLGFASISTASQESDNLDEGVVTQQDSDLESPNVCEPPKLEDETAPMTNCFNCGSDSSGQCSLQSGKVRMQCTGSRSDCRDRGCRITGTSSCSSAGNVGQC